MKDLFSVADKVALVTGGSRGIGKMIAKGLVENGVRVYITSRDAQACEDTAAELGGSAKCRAIPADLSKVSEIERVIAEIESQESALHILVNNAGAGWGAPIEEFPENGWDKVMSLNVKSIFFMIQKSLPLLRKGASEKDPARIINIGSVEGLHVPELENYPYSVSKAAVHHLTRHVASRVSRDYITTNSISPGPFETKMTAKMPGFHEIVDTKVPLRRVGGLDDIAGMVIFLSSRAGSYVNAATLPLDGGWVGVL